MSQAQTEAKAQGYVAFYLRLALGTAFLSAVADRFGVWGPPGSRNVAWGAIPEFLTYAGRINPWAPAGMVPFLGWTATALEVVCGVLLLVGWKARWIGLLSGVLLLLFAIGMTLGTGVKTAFDASVFSASAAGFALAVLGPGRWSLDRVSSPSPTK